MSASEPLSESRVGECTLGMLPAWATRSITSDRCAPVTHSWSRITIVMSFLLEENYRALALPLRTGIRSTTVDDALSMPGAASFSVLHDG
jgi:hypothetical protein